MKVQYIEYVFLKIKISYLDRLFTIDHLIKSRNDSFDHYDGNPFDKNYSKKINAYYTRHLDHKPKLIYSDFYYTETKYYEKYRPIIKYALDHLDENNYYIVSITKEKIKRVKDPRLRLEHPDIN